MKPARTGRCYCGAVQYEIDGDLGPFVNCHCRYCRRAHGAAFATVSLVRTADFRFVAGEDAVRVFRTPEGSRSFCGQCGGRLFNQPLSTSAFLTLVVASLDEERGERPVMHINVESKAGWYDILDGLPQFPALPPGAASALDR